MSIVVCLKWVAHPGEPRDERFAGASPADQAALELALQQAERQSTTVTAVTVGPVGAERILRDAAAAGASRVVRVDADADLPSAEVALALASVARDASWVWCGDYSLDRGTGSVPAFLAAELTARQALGVIGVEHGDSAVRVVRRLDGGRRELLDVGAPAVVSVEGAVATLRRAGLGAVRRSLSMPVEVRTWSVGSPSDPVIIGPYRPRARALAAPVGATAVERLHALTDAASAASARGETVVLPPAQAAARIIRALVEWGSLAGDD